MIHEATADACCAHGQRERTTRCKKLQVRMSLLAELSVKFTLRFESPGSPVTELQIYRLHHDTHSAVVADRSTSVSDALLACA